MLQNVRIYQPPIYLHLLLLYAFPIISDYLKILKYKHKLAHFLGLPLPNFYDIKGVNFLIDLKGSRIKLMKQTEHLGKIKGLELLIGGETWLGIQDNS